ncbi:tetrapyrrole biosynthesis, uroporphyrinogen III synthase [Tricholoma matsutake]|nr:tetrapyrrole biosynthesis, uroporphyrinogen III synthase [Tricholoma matsutake 945]
MANVLLLRASPTGDEDRYSTAFSAGYNPVSVPVLETVPTNLTSLKEIVRSGPDYDGVIMTSARSCEAWKSVVGVLVGESSLGTNGGGSARWPSIPFYVVGQATASALLSVRAIYDNSPYAPGPALGESSGTSEQLVNFILSLEGSSRPKKLLYLTGDKNRDTVPRILGEAGIAVNPIKVYETQFSSSFTQDLETALQSASKGFDQWWIVHFAPSSAKSAIPILRHHFDFNISPQLGTSESTSRPRSAVATARIASIGPVTTLFLQDELKMHVHATASRPTPQDLVAAISNYDQDVGVLGDRSS